MDTRQSYLLLDPPSLAEFCRRGSLREKDAAQSAPFPSIDLILLSGAVRDAGFQPIYLDAQMDNLDWDMLAGRVRGRGIAGVVSLISSSQIDAELEKLRELKIVLGGVPVYAVGTIMIQLEPHRVQRLLQENPWLDGIILNAAEHNLGVLLAASDPESVEPVNVAVQRADGPLVPEIRVSHGGSLRIPRPEHAIFRDRRYCFPQSKRTPVTCVQFSLGCPFTCEFCIDNQLYRKMLYREVSEVVEELVEIDRLGFREVYFKDLTFGLNKKISTEFLEELAARKLRLRWLCTTRVDVATPRMLRLMRRAGCYGIEFGVEHAKEDVRQRVTKRISNEHIRGVFADCRRLGIETTAFILLAMEDDTEADVRATIRFARSIRPDYVSFNVLNALPGTSLEARARREGFLREGAEDYRFVASNIKHRYLSPTQVEALRREANRTFYFRPSLVLDRLLKLRSFFEFRKLVRLSWDTVWRPLLCT
ncbi:MAG: radical SAM protein [bacterium]|nr:radical SAM protein [bacterium]